MNSLVLKIKAFNMSLDLLPPGTANAIRLQAFPHFGKKRTKQYHLGCASLMPIDWLNIDLRDGLSIGEFHSLPGHLAPGAYFLNWDLTNGIPANQDTLELVYHSHFLEHLSFPDGLRLLDQIYLALEKGGRHRIVVPDLEKYCNAYISYHNNFLDLYKRSEKLLQAEVYETRGSTFVSQFYEHGHKMAWDFETLSLALKKAGFVNIKKSSWRQSDFPDLESLEEDGQFRIQESLYIECEK
jgi:predicted SAM-dependent methyltransferase